MFDSPYLFRLSIVIPCDTKDLVKMLEETGTKVSISTVKRVLYLHNLKEPEMGLFFEKPYKNPKSEMFDPSKTEIE